MKDKICLVSDGASDVTVADAKKRGIILVPFFVIDVERGEDLLLNADELYAMMLANPQKKFKTGCPSVDTYYQIFNENVKQGKKVICVCITNAFSGSFSSATTAKNMVLEKHPEAMIEVVDSQMNSVLEGELVFSIADMIDEGMDFEEILRRVQKLIPTGQIMFSVGNLDYLRYGGRIGLLKSLVAKTLSVKPIIIMRDGDIVSGGFGLGVKMALSRILEMVKSHFQKIGEKIENFRFCVGYGCDKEQGVQFLQRVRSFFGMGEEVSINQIGLTSAVHVGPQTVGVCFIKKYQLV